MTLLHRQNDSFRHAKWDLETHKMTTLVDPQNDISSRKSYNLGIIKWRRLSRKITSLEPQNYVSRLAK